MEHMMIYDRLQFAMTVTFHYLFPQLTMGLALFLVYFKSRAVFGGNEHYNAVVRFWSKVFAITFVFGVVTGIPMEFQFGTNWARFSDYAGGVIGQTLAMEGAFAFFLESTFLGIVLFGEKRLGQRVHWFATFMLFVGTWLSAYFIIATNAWMQHPVAYEQTAGGQLAVNSLVGLLTNRWILWQYLHNMTAAVVTTSFVVAGAGAFYLLSGKNRDYGKTFVRTGVIAAAVSSALIVFPTGDGAARQVFDFQPEKAAAMEGIFKTEDGAPLVILGQPNMATQTLDNPLEIPMMLSFLTYRRFTAEIVGLDAFPQERWPDNVPLVYYAYHIMVGLGTIFAGIMILSLLFLWRGRLYDNRWLLWLIFLATPFPYISTTAGWITAEVGRQPWLVYGLMRTAQGNSPLVNEGNSLFTLLGFLGLYFVMGMLYLLLVLTLLRNGPQSRNAVDLLNGTSPNAPEAI
jgi:cytochrome d ubiquinol oxidase subunit I